MFLSFIIVMKFAVAKANHH